MPSKIFFSKSFGQKNRFSSFSRQSLSDSPLRAETGIPSKERYPQGRTSHIQLGWRHFCCYHCPGMDITERKALSPAGGPKMRRVGGCRRGPRFQQPLMVIRLRRTHPVQLVKDDPL